MEIVDYQPKYAKYIDDMEISQWGDWGENIKDLCKPTELIRIAFNEDSFAGVAYGEKKENYFWIDVICVLPKFQKKGFGKELLKDIIHEAKKRFKVSVIKTESVYVNGKSNSKKLLEDAGFVFTGEEKGFWGKKYKEVYCTECNKMPCECTAMFYELHF